MSIDVGTIRLLMDGGFGGQEMLVVAEAMERGEDRDFIWLFIEKMEAADSPEKATAIGVIELAAAINETNANRDLVRTRHRDEHTGKWDSNKSRRGISNQRWSALRLEVFERDGYACRYCGCVEDLTCDHVVPLAKGGTNDLENLTPACRSCNSSKGDKLLSEWAAFA